MKDSKQKSDHVRTKFATVREFPRAGESGTHMSRRGSLRSRVYDVCTKLHFTAKFKNYEEERKGEGGEVKRKVAKKAGKAAKTDETVTDGHPAIGHPRAKRRR